MKLAAKRLIAGGLGLGFLGIGLWFLPGAMAQDHDRVNRLLRQVEQQQKIEENQRKIRQLELIQNTMRINRQLATIHRFDEDELEIMLANLRGFARLFAEHSYDITQDGVVDEDDYEEIQIGYENAIQYFDELDEETIYLLDQNSDNALTEEDLEIVLDNVKKLMSGEVSLEEGSEESSSGE